MNMPSVVALAVLFVPQFVHAQTADELAAQGRAYLAATNLPAANRSFSNAVALAPAHPAANVLYGLTRLLVWPSQPAGSNFLTRLGLPTAGRNIYNWTAQLPADTNGVPLAPTGVSAAEATALLRTNLLAEALGAEQNLQQASTTNFTLSLTAAETQTVDVTLDYGDILMLRAMLQGAAYLGYSLNTWNLDAQLSAVRAAYNNDQFDLQQLLLEYPNLLTFATTNDLVSARTAFTNAAHLYLRASEWIRSRPSNVVCLFNLDPSKADAEWQFRLTLGDLVQSLNGAVPLQIAPQLAVSLAPRFDGLNPLRGFLPRLQGTGFILGTLPDPTFGGTVWGLSRGEVEQSFARLFTPIPFVPAMSSPGMPFSFQINTLKDRAYVVQVSSNLLAWSDYAVFIGSGETHVFTELLWQYFPHRFYRVVDRPVGQLPPPANNYFANAAPVTGLGIEVAGYNANASGEPGEPGYSWNSVWYDWVAPASGYVVISTHGSVGWKSVNVFTGSSLATLSPVSYASYPGQYHNGFSFYATSGTTYHIQIGGSPGVLHLVITFPPDLIVTSPFDGTISPATTNLHITALAVDLDGTIAGMRCFGDGHWLHSTTNDNLDTSWAGVGQGVHSIQVEALDNLGITTTESLTVTVRPPNDDFSNAIPILALPATVTGSNLAASKEPGEPAHAGQSGGASIWWCWTAPTNGLVSIRATLEAWYPSLYPTRIPSLLAVYTGTVVSNLVTIASASLPLYAEDSAQVSFHAQAGVTYHIAVDGKNAGQGPIILYMVADAPPTVAITSPTNMVFYTTSTTNITIAADASDPDGTLREVSFFLVNQAWPRFLLGGEAVTNSPYSVTWTFSSGDFLLLSKAIDNSGLTAISSRGIGVQPTPTVNNNYRAATTR